MAHERLYKAMNQRILMIHEDIDIHDCEGVYTILGSTGKQYRVRVSVSENTCTCPDHSMRLVDCKHILFVLFQVLGIDRESLNQDTIIRKSLFVAALARREVFISRQRTSPNAIKHEEEKKELETTLVRKQIEGMDCPICLETLETGEKIVYCKKTCGNNFHDYCFSKWKRANGNDATCPMCRGRWI